MEKCCLLNLLAEPFGFCYESRQDLFSTRTDAWQKTFGYGRIYDKAAASMNMVFDTESVYFDDQEKTWMIQFWKGQYGITTGAEIGLYHADSLIPPSLRSRILFHAAGETEMLPMQIRLIEDGAAGDQCLFCFFRTHWWLTGFIPGKYTAPENLKADITITFPNTSLCASFIQGLLDAGYEEQEIYQEHTTVRFLFSAPKMVSPSPCPAWRQKLVLRKNRLLCKLYLRITAPFCCTVDRLLYLYYYLPFIFRKIISMQVLRKKGLKPAAFQKELFP